MKRALLLAGILGAAGVLVPAYASAITLAETSMALGTGLGVVAAAGYAYNAEEQSAGDESAPTETQAAAKSALRNPEALRHAIPPTKGQVSDADLAFEIASLARFQILHRAGIAAVSHANANSKAALELLG